VLVSAIRFSVSYFTTDKRFLYLFALINTVILILTYQAPSDIIVYMGILFIIIGNFQKHDKDLRRIMMVGTSCILTYNIIIFTPMGIVVEAIFLSSNIVGYYRHYMRKKKKSIKS